MPEYIITDPATGKKVRLTGDSPPTEAELEGIFASIQPAAESQYNPTEGMSGSQRFLAGVGKGMTDVARGIGQAAGVVSQEDVAAARERDRPLMQTGAGMAGNIAGNVAAALPAMLIPGANTVTGATLVGAGLGAVAPTVEGESRLSNAAMGAAGGLAGGMIAKGASRVLSPQTNQSARQMIGEGITPTPGQTLGGVFRRTEEAAKSIPFVGEGIRQAERRGIEEFNRASINRVLAPIGQRATAIGNEGVEQARILVSGAYDDALNNLARVDIDPQFKGQLNRITAMTRTLPENIQNQFKTIISTQLDEKLTPAGTMSAEQFKTVTSEFGKLAQGYKGATNSFDQNQLGDALLSVRESLMNLAGRTNPAARDGIKRADRAYAQLLRVENAASKAQEGIFTPTQLATAARQLDSSSRKSASAQGKALMQDFAQQGRNVLANRLPDSGTAERAMLGGLALGGAAIMNPGVAMATAAGMGAARAAYTPTGQRLISSMLTQRPEIINALGGTIGRLTAPAGAAGSVMLQGAQQ
jgi:hypothetical protein